MYKTILVHVDGSRHAPARIRCAAALARAHGAHLIGAAMFGVLRHVFPRGYASRPGTLSASYFEPLAANARRALEQFSDIAAQMDVAHEARFVCDQADDGLAGLSRFADLLVLSQDDPAESMPDMAVHLPEHVILNGVRPVLVVPRSGAFSCEGTNVLVGWDGSKEAAGALDAALPLLRKASNVVVAALAGADERDGDFRAQQPDLQDWLARQQVPARVLVRAPKGDTGHALLGLAGEFGCGMLVMGASGRSRLRALRLRGASRTVLAEADIAVLMAH